MHYYLVAYFYDLLQVPLNYLFEKQLKTPKLEMTTLEV
jgi:hypothetical protein